MELTDQTALYELTRPLAETLSPTSLGQINRTHSHIRLVARKLLSLAKPQLDNVLINQIVESLAEKIYVHGHSIGVKEGKQIGIRVEEMDSELEKLCWQLYLIYEKMMKLNSPGSLEEYFHDELTDDYAEDYAVLGCIESLQLYHEFSGSFLLKRQREMQSATGPQPIYVHMGNIVMHTASRNY